MKQENLRKYANLLLRKGVNLQEGQEIVISSSTEHAYFVEMLVDICYKDIKSGLVHINWSNDAITRSKYEHATQEVLNHVPGYSVHKMQELVDKGACTLGVGSANPDLLKGIDPKRIAEAGKAGAKVMRPFVKYRMDGTMRWCGSAIASKTWATKVFPDLDADEAVEKLWDYIFKATRVDLEDPVAAWDEHIKNLHAKQDWLNEENFEYLHYEGEGTDLMVKLPERHLWVSAGQKGKGDTFYIPNIPTEEVFTTPSRSDVNGTLRSTMPLNLRGSLIEDFSFVFKDGKIVDFDAKEGKEALEFLIKMDDGAARLGEVALVPHDSPISNLNTLFFNTLYDENASCHFAVGNAIDFAIKDGFGLSNEDKEKLDINHSLTHVDFMVGSSELNITGIKKDGTKVAVFVKGNWA
jgi:aminopeptidase